jgi:hypothetical protein
MSQLIGNALPQFRLETDVSLLAIPWQQERERARAGQPQSYATPFWPTRSGFIGDMGADVGLLESDWYETEDAGGTTSMFGYQGTTRDVNNSPLGNATVKLFRTSDDSKVLADVVSAADGTFVAPTPYYEPHWLRMSKAGSPDVQCTTVSTTYPNT